MGDQRLTSLDGIAVFLTGLVAAGLFAFPFAVGRHFGAMFADFGSAPLPPLTGLAVSVWFPCALGAMVAGGPVLACIPAVPLAYRRRVLVAAFVLGCVSVGVCVVGVYLPLFELADKIKP
jgi:hypothetical protein